VRPAAGRQYGQRDEEGEPVVVDLAVAHRDEHPYEVEAEDGPAQRPRRPSDRREYGRHNQCDEDGVDDQRCWRRQVQQARDEQRVIQAGIGVGVAAHPRREDDRVQGGEGVDERTEQGDAPARDRCEQPPHAGTRQSASTTSW
jgi:hypothetical protein